MSTVLRFAGLSVLVLASACGEAVVGSSRFANTPPTVDPIADVTTLEDTPTSTTVTFVDAEDLEVIAVAAESDNAALIDASGIAVSGTGGARTIALTPKPNANGSATITVTITDGGGHVDPIVLTFTFTVTPVNDPPVITGLADVTIDEDGSTGPNAFTITDVDDDLATIVVTATSSDLAVAPTVTITAGGTPGSYTWSVTPPANANGASTLTFSANDGTDTTTDTITLTVTSVNDQPTFTQTITPQTFNEDATIPGLALAVDDVETALPALVVTATSSNPALLDATRITVTSGAGGARTLTLDPFDNMFGTSTITVTVDDGSGAPNATNTFTFLLTINSVNDLPTITAIANQTFNEDDAAGTGAIAFTVTDVEDDLAMTSMVVTATSNQPGTVPNDAAHLVLTTVTRNDRTITVLSLPDANTFPPPAFTNVPVTVTVTVTDSNGAPAQRTFTVTVNPENDPPRLDPIASIATPEDTATSFSVTFRDPDSNLDNVVISFTTSDGVVLPGGISETGRITDTTDPLDPFQTRTYSLTPVLDAFHTGGASTTVTVTGTSEGFPSNPRTFTVTVTPVNDAPVINIAATITTTEGTATPATSFTLTDVDNTLTLANLSVTANSNTTLIPTANIVFGGTPAAPTITLTPVGDNNGNATITVRIDDGSGAANRFASDTFTFTVTAVNDPPDLMDVADQTTNEDTNLVLTVTFTDPDGCTGLTLTGTSGNTALVANAGVVASPTSSTVCSVTLTVTPLPNRNTSLNGTTTISLSLTDNANGGPGALTDTDTFVLDVVADPDFPIVVDESYTSEGNQTVDGTTLLANDSDPDQGTLTITGQSNETGGTVTIAMDGSFTFFPTAGFLGAAGFDYTVSNGGLTTDGHVTITIGTRMHWYVDSSLTGPGDGTEADPFVDLADVTTSIQWSAGEDWIHLDYGDGTAYNGATLDDDCDLLGIPGGVSGTTPPTITDATCVEMNGTSIISDVLLEDCSSIAIDAIGLTTSLSIVDVTIDGGATGLSVNGSGTGVGPAVSFDGLIITDTTTVAVVMQDATLTTSGTNTIGAANGSGFVATNVAFGSGGAGTTISDVTVGSTTTPSTSGFGISLDACIGELTVTEIDLHASTAGNGILLDDARLEITNLASVIATTGSGYSIRVLESGGTSSLEGQVGSITCTSSAARCVSIEDADLNFSVMTDFDAAATGNFRALLVRNTGGTRFRIVDGDGGVLSSSADFPTVELIAVTGLDVTLRQVNHPSANTTGILLSGTAGRFHVLGDGTGARNSSGGVVVSNNAGEVAASVTGLSDVVLRSMDLSNSANNGVAVLVDGTAVVDLDGCLVDGGANGVGINATTYQGELTLTGTRVTSTERMLVVTTPGNGDSVVTIDDTAAATSAFDTGEADGRCVVLASSGTHAATLDISSTSFSACGVYGVEAQAVGSGIHLVRVASSSFPTSATTTSAVRMTSANAASHELRVTGSTFGTTIGDVIDFDGTTCTGRSLVTLTSNAFGTLDSFESGSTTGNAVAVNLTGGNGCAVVHTFTSNNIYGVQDASRAGLNLDYTLSGTADSNLEIHSNVVDLTAGAATTNASALRINSAGAKGVCMDVDGNTFDSANPGWDVNATSGTTTARSIVESSQTGWTSILTPMNSDNTLSNVRVTETMNGFMEGTCNGAL